MTFYPYNRGSYYYKWPTLIIRECSLVIINAALENNTETYSWNDEFLILLIVYDKILFRVILRIIFFKYEALSFFH